MSSNVYSSLDLMAYQEVATDSIQKAIDSFNFELAHIRLASYLLEMNNRLRQGEIEPDVWHEVYNFYSRLTADLIEAENLTK